MKRFAAGRHQATPTRLKVNEAFDRVSCFLIFTVQESRSCGLNADRPKQAFCGSVIFFAGSQNGATRIVCVEAGQKKKTSQVMTWDVWDPRSYGGALPPSLKVQKLPGRCFNRMIAWLLLGVDRGGV